MLEQLTYKSLYRNNNDNFDSDFLVPCFAHSSLCDRASGFFSVRSLFLSIDGIIKFVAQNGKMRLICSPKLSEEDIKLIEIGQSLSVEHITQDLLNEFNINTEFSEIELSKLDVVCNMISSGLLSIRIAFMPDGMFHEKFGIFKDNDGNAVHYIGSANETPSAKLHNRESFTVNCSWDSKKDCDVIIEQSLYFDKLWNNIEEGVAVVSFPDVVKNKLFATYQISPSLDQALDAYYKASNIKLTQKKLHKYQEKAIQQFVENGFSHFYEMATGTGKTFTSIRTITRLQSELNEKIFVMICVPQVDLQSQWKDALEEDGYSNIYLLGGISNNTSADFSKALITYRTKNASVICVAVYDTFFSKIYNKCNIIDNLFFIVDEAHNLAPNQFAHIPKNVKFRLGLSATIQRFSQVQTNNIIQYFTKGTIKPFFYGIEDAIDNGYLSRYFYYPIFVHLSEDEFEKYQKKTLSISYALNKEERDQEEINTLCRERSRIVKQATNKKSLLHKMANSPEYEFRNSVVYCGQGKEDDDPIIDYVTKSLYEAGLNVSTFTSKTANRPKVLYEFSNGYYDTLVAMKCFDEGVDVPKLDKIYIMASDTSLRQTVQRRGRVLRVCKETNKQYAYIFDMFTLPPQEISIGVGVHSLLANEVNRATEYARVSENKDEIMSVINGLKKSYSITDDDLNNEKELD